MEEKGNFTDNSFNFRLPKKRMEIFKESVVAFIKDVESKVAPVFADFLVVSISVQMEQVLNKYIKNKRYDKFELVNKT